MAKPNFKVTPTDSFPLGHASENKDASAYTGFKYPSGGGNDIGVYKQPEVNSNDNSVEARRDPNTYNASENNAGVPACRVSIGTKAGVKSDGVETRGNGAATKGRTARGPMGYEK